MTARNRILAPSAAARSAGSGGGYGYGAGVTASHVLFEKIRSVAHGVWADSGPYARTCTHTTHRARYRRAAAVGGVAEAGDFLVERAREYRNASGTAKNLTEEEKASLSRRIGGTSQRPTKHIGRSGTQTLLNLSCAKSLTEVMKLG